MFNWLRRKYAKRNIFNYWDGERYRSIDPVAAWRIMWSHPDCSPEHDLGPAAGIDFSTNEEMEFDQEAQDRVIEMSRDMFAVKEWKEDQPGLTIDETLDLFWKFLNYIGELKKKRNHSLMRLRRTESASSPRPSTTPLGSDSSSTSQEQPSDKPPSSSKRSVRL